VLRRLWQYVLGDRARERRDRERGRLEAELRQSRAQARTLSACAARAEEAERARIARLLHDDLAQLLAGAKLKLEGLRDDGQHAGPGELARAQGDVCRWLAHALDQIRRLTTVELGPPDLASRDLPAALSWLCAQHRRLHGLNVAMTIADANVGVAADVAIVLVRVARELLFNVVKHAGVCQARLDLRRRGDRVELCVSDGGRGFSPDAFAAPAREADRGFGLRDVESRLALVGGWLLTRSAPGRGARVTASVPVAVAPFFTPAIGLAEGSSGPGDFPQVSPGENPIPKR
jgi:signal transduction histidine kinase